MSGIVWEERPQDLRDPVIVVAFRGWNDAGAAASTAVTAITGELGARRLGALDAEDHFDLQATRPMVDLTLPQPELRWPEIEIRLADGGARDLLLVTGPEPSMRWRTMCTALLDQLTGLGAATVVTLGAFLADVPHTRAARLTGMSTDPGLARRLGLRDPSYRGPTGIVGVFHHMAAARGLRATSLWAPAAHYAAGIPNAKAALALVETFTTVTGATVPTGALRSSAEAFERQVDRAVRDDSRLMDLVRQLEAAADEADAPRHADLPSGDELARELERYLREREGDG
ncbi:MAG: PAC2 family protein [Thermoleophilia bacterium]|nr:PAC2 family protein [Thermoleophilia bacterium]